MFLFASTTINLTLKGAICIPFFDFCRLLFINILILQNIELFTKCLVIILLTISLLFLNIKLLISSQLLTKSILLKYLWCFVFEFLFKYFIFLSSTKAYRKSIFLYSSILRYWSPFNFLCFGIYPIFHNKILSIIAITIIVSITILHIVTVKVRLYYLNLSL